MLSRRKKVSLPTINSPDPIRGYKHAFLGTTATFDDVQFLACTGRTAYGPEESATCISGKSFKRHSVPDIDCSCGFYAFKDGNKIFPSGALALLEVDLYGKILEFERGYRAEYQRVIAAQYTDTCCLPACWNPFEYFARAPYVEERHNVYDAIVPLCRRHRGIMGQGYIRDDGLLDSLSTELWEVNESNPHRLVLFDVHVMQGVLEFKWVESEGLLEHSDGAA